MFLKSGEKISHKIKFLIDEEIAEPVRFAVAFWGKGADYNLRGPCRIVCDLGSGACNPEVIRQLLKRDKCVVLKLSGLHAKVVIGSNGAVVSSANMSINGLGAEGSDASGTIEAGYFLPARQPEYQEVVTWFDELWEVATAISEIDLVDAQEKWDAQHRYKPVTSPIKPESDIVPFHINAFTLLEERIDARDRIRAVKKNVFDQFKSVLPNVEHRRLGKIASWACHLLLNRAGLVLYHSAGNMEDAGVATDQWIVDRFGKKKKNDTIADVETLLKAIRRSLFFSADIRRAANQVLSAPPWMADDLSRSVE